MKSKQCWQCGVEAEGSAKQCPSCKAALGSRNPKGIANTPEEESKLRKRGCFGCLGGLLVLGLIGVAVDTCGTKAPAQPQAQGAVPAPSRTPAPDALAAMQKALDGLSGVESATATLVDGKVKVDLVVSPGVVTSGNNFVLTTAGTIHRAFKDLAEAKQLDRLWMAVVTLKAPMVDSYGQKSQVPVLRYAFRGEDLAKIAWENLGQQQLLDFAALEWLHLEGAMMVKEYALEGRHREDAPTFCRIAIEGRRN